MASQLQRVPGEETGAHTYLNYMSANEHEHAHTHNIPEYRLDEDAKCFDVHPRHENFTKVHFQPLDEGALVVVLKQQAVKKTV